MIILIELQLNLTIAKTHGLWLWNTHIWPETIILKVEEGPSWWLFLEHETKSRVRIKSARNDSFSRHCLLRAGPLSKSQSCLNSIPHNWDQYPWENMDPIDQRKDYSLQTCPLWENRDHVIWTILVILGCKHGEAELHISWCRFLNTIHQLGTSKQSMKYGNFSQI